MNSAILIVCTFAAFSAADTERDRFHGSLEQKLNLMDQKLQDIERKIDQMLERSCGNGGGSSPSSDRACLSGWTRGPESTCVKIMTDRKTWMQAETSCRQLNAELVSITSERMNDFLKREITDDTWIGLNDRDEEGEWKWKNGNRMLGSFKKWESGNPHHNWDSYNCAYVRKSDGKWLDQSCDQQKRFACEKRG